ANGDVEHPLSSLLNKRRKCTVCLPNPNPVSLWETWLADRLQMAGSIVITDEAAKNFDGESAISRNDVADVNGDFSRGDVLHIYDQAGTELARGLTDFNAEEARILMRNLELPARQLLGYQSDAEFIRPENMVIIEDRHLAWDAPDKAA
ncbi:MAG: PUA domain-containing protein, partial [Pseudomonadota bacterium]